MKIGDAVTVPGGYEGFVYEFERYNQKGTVCVYINFHGDGNYVDYDPKSLTPMDWTNLSQEMKKECTKLKQKRYRKELL